MKKTRNVYHFAIRKCKRAAETIIKDRLVENCATNKIDVFSELKKMRHVNTDPPSKIDGNEKPEKDSPRFMKNCTIQLTTAKK